MASWVYVFSRFTPEALLIEAVVILALICGYAAFWVLRKRRFGSVGQEVPSTVVKTYLNELITEAELIRAQLFGLLTNSGSAGAAQLSAGAGPTLAMLSGAGGVSAGSLGSNDPELIKKFSSLELKVLEQARSMEAMLAEKAKLEKDLNDARATSGGGGGAGGDPAALAKLNEKIKLLESRLAEYSVIEDDLANLKRLQQENAQLKAALSQQVGTGAAAAATAATAAPIAATAAATAATAAPIAATAAEAVAQPEPAVADPVAAAAPPAPEAAPAAADPLAEMLAAAATPPEAAAAPTPEANFEGLVNQVEQSLQPALAEAAPAPAAPPAGGEKSDADLVAEFEKMLNG
jgi:hypothetical protein